MDRRRFLTALGIGGGALVVGGAASATTTHLVDGVQTDSAREDGAYAAGAGGRQQLVWSVDTTEPVIAFTFDDGPNPRFTPRVIDMLALRNAKATFFMIGRLVEQYPELVRRVVNAGHEIGNHSWSHQSAALLTADETRDEVLRGADAIQRVTGVAPKWYRPPRGMLTGTAARWAQERHEGVAIWSATRGPGNIADADAAGVRDHLLTVLQPGAIVDLHDGLGRSSWSPASPDGRKLRIRRDAELEALPDVLDAAIGKGLRLVTLSELLAAAR